MAAPAAYWLYSQGYSGWAIFMVLWGVMVGSIDNVIKPLLISRGVSTPMILVMFGVFGGVMAFGLVGLFIGPTVLALGYTLAHGMGGTVIGTAAAVGAATDAGAPLEPQPADARETRIA